MELSHVDMNNPTPTKKKPNKPNRHIFHIYTEEKEHVSDRIEADENCMWFFYFIFIFIMFRYKLYVVLAGLYMHFFRVRLFFLVYFLPSLGHSHISNLLQKHFTKIVRPFECHGSIFSILHQIRMQSTFIVSGGCVCVRICVRDGKSACCFLPLGWN